MLGKMEKRLSVLAICFVIIYLVAAGLTVHSRISKADRTVRIEGTGPQPGESEMMMAQLFLPMLIVLTVAVCFVVVRRRRGAALDALEDPEEEKSEIPENQHR
jgi:cytochrome bd-type quinol oxidase subunit 2